MSLPSLLLLLAPGPPEPRRDAFEAVAPTADVSGGMPSRNAPPPPAPPPPPPPPPPTLLPPPPPFPGVIAGLAGVLGDADALVGLTADGFSSSKASTTLVQMSVIAKSMFASMIALYHAFALPSAALFTPSSLYLARSRHRHGCSTRQHVRVRAAGMRAVSTRPGERGGTEGR